ncbi:MAG: hypothetical protein O9301_13560 [Leptospira sp.]|nr:hypothetical protein [Leptospira sp.]
MKTKLVLFLFAIISVALLNQCATGVKSRSLLFRSNEFAIYSVKRDKVKLKTDSLIPQKLSHPLEITEDKVLDILGNIKYRRESSYGDLNLYVFDDREIKDFSLDLVDGLQKLKEDEILLIVSKYNAVKSVVSHYTRTGFYLWATDSSIELMFGEIQQEVPYEEQGNYYDWSNISDISFDFSPDVTYVLPGNGYTFKKVTGFRNRRWLVFNKSELSRLKFEKRKKNSKEITNSVESDLSPEKRIKKDDEDELIND